MSPAWGSQCLPWLSGWPEVSSAVEQSGGNNNTKALSLPAPMGKLIDSPSGHTEGLLFLHHSYQFFTLGPHSCPLNWLKSTTSSQKPWKYMVTGLCFWSWRVRAGTYISNIYDFHLGSCFLNSWTAIQISHSFNGIFGFSNGYYHFKYLHSLFIIKNSLSLTMICFIELEMFPYILNSKCSYISKQSFLNKHKQEFLLS